MRLTERLPRESGREYALRTIRENIVGLELVPGGMVSENELAAEMGLSRTPVREALIELSRIKIVEIYPQRGSSVALIDMGLVEEARFVRRMLECAVVEECCRKVTEEGLQRMEENLHLQRFYLTARQNGTQSLWELDRKFHELLFELADRPNACRLVKSMLPHAERVRQLAGKEPSEEDVVGDHALVLQAIENGDAAAAVAQMQKHLDRVNVDLNEMRALYPAYFR